MSAAIASNLQNQERLDRDYDVENSVPDFMVYANQYVSESARARHDFAFHANIPFGPTRAEHADIYPANRPGAPVLVFIHGGYWRMLTAKEFSFVASGFIPHDVTVVVANYDLCPKVSIPEIARQMRALIAWCARNITAYHGDAHNLSVCGHSAGGHLAAMCALTDWSDYGLPADTIHAVIPISGLFDLEPISRSFMQPELQISDRDIYEASPIRRMRTVPTHMLISHGSEEPAGFITQSEAFLTAWREAGNSADIFALPGRNHFDAITDLGDADSRQVAAILDVMGACRAKRRPSRIDRRLFPQKVLS